MVKLLLSPVEIETYAQELISSMLEFMKESLANEKFSSDPKADELFKQAVRKSVYRRLHLKS